MLKIEDLIQEEMQLVTGGKLNTDLTPERLSPDNHSYALNTINITDEGEIGKLSNEESNELFTNIPIGYIPIGKVYLTEGNTALFLVSDNGLFSEIGIMNDLTGYETQVNTTVLNFKIDKPIDAVYRLRKGCERTIYFTDDFNKPRYFNFDKPYNFKIGGNWNADKFNLFSTYKSIPVFNKIEVLTGGEIKSGSYNFAIQYIDAELNTTEWITTSEPINIYNDNLTAAYSNINGSIATTNFYRKGVDTNKAIKLTLSNIDTQYPFFRVAIICSNTGLGLPTKVLVSDKITSIIPSFIFTGNIEGYTEVPIEDIQGYNLQIERAKNIEQLENRLILSNIQGKQTKYCNLQKYASQITADCVLEEIELNNINSINNVKRPTIYNEKVGYMPGEIYSFGIVYIFEDMSISPVYHIPGKNHSTEKQTFSASAPNIFPMSIDNESTDIHYTSLNTCGGSSTWGKDSEGDDLEGALVRHHRFPLRSELKTSLVEQETSSGSYVINTLNLSISGSTTATGQVNVKVTYTDNGITNTTTQSFDLTSYNPANGLTLYLTTSNSTLSYVSTVEIDSLGNPVTTPSGLSYTGTLSSVNGKSESTKYKTKILGIKFSNINVPLDSDIQDKVIGYYIVRNERTEEDKTILDSGVLFPLIEKKDINANKVKFSSFGQLFPEIQKNGVPLTDVDIDKKVFGFVNPEYKFKKREYSNFDVLVEGVFEPETNNSKVDGMTLTQDTQAGTSFNPDVNAGDDNDGIDLHIWSRQYKLKYTPQSLAKYHIDKILANDIEDYFYLTSLKEKSTDIGNGNKKEIYNISTDNNNGFFTLKNNRNIDYTREEKIKPYVVFRRKKLQDYPNFKSRQYFKESRSMSFINSDSVIIFNGDSFISPLNYTSSMFYEFRQGCREGKGKSVLEWVATGVLAVAGVAAIVLTAGAATPLVVGAIGVLAVGTAVVLAANGLKMEEMKDILEKKYQEGLKDTVKDFYTKDRIDTNCPPDDEFRWFSDHATNLWFESSINTSWRLRADSIPDFLEGPGVANKEQIEQYMIRKLTVTDSDNKDGKMYRGCTTAELYDVNLDFERRNKEKSFYHLPEEYDCCSKCQEDFPHRVHYSEQSYQEELSDNFKKFLHNNYKDIDGETGEIMDIFKLGNDLYIHTKEALWKLPKNYQERVTGEITSFIGTGSFFEIPPQKVLDDDTGTSAGIQHKWSSIKTPTAYYFVAEKERKIYEFKGDGNLKPISNEGMYNWFLENIPVEQDLNYYLQNKKEYTFRDNTSNPIGTGFLSTFDHRKNRVIFTKKDYKYSSPNTGSGDYELCYLNGVTKIFQNFSQIISNQLASGWEYLGMENCRMKFVKNVVKTKTVTTYEKRNKFKDVDFLVFRYNFGASNGTDLDTRSQLLTPTTAGPYGFCSGGTSSPYFQWGGDNMGSGLESILINVAAIKAAFPGQNLITFSCKTWWFGSRGDGNMNMNAEGYQGGTMNHVGFNFTNSGGTLLGTYSFPTVNVPAGGGGSCNPSPTDLGVFTFNIETGELSANGLSAGSVPPEEEIIETTKTVTYLEPEYMYIDGIVDSGSSKIDTSWTLSYSLLNNSWISWHSYRPDFYINTQKYFFSWKAGIVNNPIWKHGKKGEFTKYYNTPSLWSIELNLKSEDLNTRLWSFIQYLTKAKKWDSTAKDYFEVEDITFDKVWFNNTRQNSGLQDIKSKDYKNAWSTPQVDYLLEQVNQSNIVVIADKMEKDWHINDIRDYTIDKNKSLFIKDKSTILNTGVYKDKDVNSANINILKDWNEVEQFRDKYLTIRFFFSNFAENQTQNTIKLIFDYIHDNSNISYH